MKNFRWIAVAVIVLIVAGAGGYLGYRDYASSKEASFACIATSFPYVIMEHKRSELSGLLDGIKLEEGEEPNLDAVDKAMRGERPTNDKYFLSKDIDDKLLELADSIQNRPEDAPALTGEDMTKFLSELEPYFVEQTQPYMNECKGLFKTVIKSCGSFEDNSDEAQECRDKFDEQVNALLEKHLQPKEL